MDTLKQAITKLHEQYRVPHIMITSISHRTPGAEDSLSVVGSTITSTNTPRMFRVQVPNIDCFFSGTGDMFAALMLVRLREAVFATEELSEKDAWVSKDDVEATDLPLAKATEKVLATMHAVLTSTKEKRDEEIAKYNARVRGRADEDDQKRTRLIESKAAEIRLVRNLESLRSPVVKFRAERV